MTQFTKMHGLGNDFVIINSLKTKTDLTTSSIAKLSNRHTGIGFDQLLVIEPSQKAEFFCRIYNSDGSEAEQCGNGLRCIARYLLEESIISKNQFDIETKAGVFSVDIKDNDHIRVCMGIPKFSEPTPDLVNSLKLKDPISILSIGNPHAVLKIDSIESFPVEKLSSQISSHPIFPDGVNIGFMQIVNDHHIRLRTIERGAGETFACGSNACAAAVSGIKQGWLQSPVKVQLAYGFLEIDWKGEGSAIFMTGPAARVFTGNVLIT